MTIELLKSMVDMTMQNREDIDEHILTLFSLTLSMKPKKVIELGVRTARSTLPFLYGCRIVGADLVSVDINDISPFMEFPQEWQDNWTFVKKDALKFLEEDFPNIWTDEGNIVYIDDWHDGDHVKRELELIDEFISPRDLIILHDLMYGNSQPNYRSVENNSDKQWDNGGPYKPISQLDLTKWEYVTIPRCHGLTILRKKSSTIIAE
jgi:cephalosporin hydroxylase